MPISTYLKTIRDFLASKFEKIRYILYKITFDRFCRGLFLILLLIWVLVYLNKINKYPSPTYAIVTLTVLIIAFAFFVGFFEILESFVIKFFGVEFSGKVRDRDKIETEVLIKDITPYRFVSSDDEFEVSTKEINEDTLSTLKKVLDIVREEK